MKRTLIAVIVVAAFLTGSLGMVAMAAKTKSGDVKDTFLIKPPWKAKKPAPKFTHTDHDKKHKIKCAECHHVYKGKKNVWKEGDKVQKCFACHKKTKDASAKGGGMTAMKAFHKNCRDCHKKKVKKGPRRCAECHKK